MARNQSRSPVTGKHRVARRTKIAMGAIGLAIAVGALAVAVTTGRTGEASADPADPSFFIDINKVPSGNNVSKLAKQGAQGSFTVNCGTNADGSHQNPDNFIAQPGIKNGAQHLHDYVGNLTTNSDSSIQSLLKGGTTCKNGDKSAYFWPVIRIDKEDNVANAQENQQAQQKQKGKTADVQGQDEAAAAADQAAAQDQNAQDQNAQDPNAQDPNAQDPNAQDQQGTKQNKKKNTGGGNAGGGNQNAQQQDQNNQQQNQNQKKQNNNQQNQNNQQQNQNQNQNQQQAKAQAAKDKAAQAAKDKAAADKAAADAAAQQELGGPEGANKEVGDNDGEIIEPESATLKFISGGADKVVQMPFGLKILYGDAKQTTNGPANARPSWTCTGFEDRLTDLYPICPQGSKVERIHNFPNCWDGKNTDSANHRTHIVFPDRNSNNCPKGFVKVPQLQITLVYDVPQDVQQNGQYKVDAFAQEAHNPRSDHDDFANVMSNAIMKRLTNCINSGKKCAE